MSQDHAAGGQQLDRVTDRVEPSHRAGVLRSLRAWWSARPRPSALTWVVMAVMLAVGAAVRVVGIGEDSLWIDEFASLQTSAGRPLKERYLTANVVLEHPPRLTALDPRVSWTQVWWSLHDDNHVPLYFMLLRLWRSALGDSEAALRMLSALASVLAIGIFFDVLRLRHGTTAAVWGSLLMALAGLQIQFAREARPYALSLALVLAAAAALVRVERRQAGLPGLIALAIAATAALFTNYFSIGPLLGLGVYAALGMRGRPRRQACLAFLLAFAAFVACWGPMAWAQRARVAGNAWLYEDGLADRWLVPEHVAAVPYRLLAGAAAFGVETDPFSPWEWALAAVILLPLLVSLRRRELWFWHAWLAGCLLPLVALDLAISTRFVGVARYVLLASPSIFAVLAVPVSRHTALGAVIPAAAAAFAAWSVPAVVELSKPPWREYGATLLNLVGDAPMVLTAEDHGERTYLGLCYYAYSPYRPVLFLKDPAGGQVLDRLRREPVVWFVSATASPLRFLPGAQVEDSVVWPGMPTLWRVRLAGAEGVTRSP